MFNDTNDARDIFRADLRTGEIRLASVPGDSGPNGDCQLQSITPDGRFAVLSGSFLVPGTTNQLGQLYVRDLDAEITYCPTKSIQLLQQQYPWTERRFLGAITPNGRYLAFRDLNIENFPAGEVHWTDLVAGTRTGLTNSIGAAGGGLAIGGDGSKVIFPSRAGLFLKEVASGATRLLVSYNQGSVWRESGGDHIADFTVDSAFTRLLYVVNTYLKPSALYGYDISQETLDFVALYPVAPVSLAPSGRFVAYEVGPEHTISNDWNSAPDVYLQRLDVLPHYRTNHLVTVAHPALREGTAAGISTLPPNSLTAAGNRVLFLSTDSSFARNDTNYCHDLFAYDHSSNAVWSVHGPLIASSPSSTNFVSLSNSIRSCAMSADGALAIFARSPGIRFGPTNVFRADLRTRTVVDLGEVATPSLSEDGRRVAYESPAFLSSSSLRNIFVRDLVEPGLFVASAKPDGSTNANGSSSSPQLTLNGRWVVFLSLATDLLDPPTLPANVPRVFARDLDKGQTRLLSLDTHGNASDQRATNFVISADGRYVVLSLGTALYRHDLLASGRVTNVLVCSNCINPSVTADGRFVLYQTTAAPRALLLADAEQGRGEPIASDAREGTISQDGRFVVFTSRASTLVPNDANAASDVFLRDRWTGATHLLSATPWGAVGNGPSSRGSISADGRRVAFQSFASDLTAGDFNGRRDVFYVLLNPPDTDNDELDDDWEAHHFGGLGRSGQGDFDADGFSDAIEHQLGSNPIDPESNLRITGIERVRLGTNGPWRTTLSWESTPGHHYRADITTNLNIPTSWLPFSDDVIPGGPVGTMTYLWMNPPPAAFYRITRVK